MKWAARRGCHVDRAACGWLIRLFIDPDASFIFLRRWDAPEDRTALLDGCAEAGGLTDAFLATWRIAIIAGEMTGIASDRRDSALAGRSLLDLLAEL